MTTEEKRLIGLCIFALVLGIIISMALGQNELPRTGALIVCLGVYFGASNISKYYSKSEKEMRTKMVFDLLEQREKAKAEPLAKEVYEKTEKSIEKIYLDTFEEIDNIQSRIIMVEGFVIIFGTFLWGFGDLIKIF